MLKIRHIQFEPGETAQRMSVLPAELRGIYGALMLCFYAGKGMVDDNVEDLANVCGTSPLMMQRLLARIKPETRRNHAKIEHKTARNDYLRALKHAQVAHKKAVTAIQVRYSKYTTSILEASYKGKGKVNTTSLPKNVPLPLLALARELSAIIPGVKSSDYHALEAVAAMYGDSRWEEVKELARESAKKRYPIAYFFALLKKRMGYQRQSRGGMQLIGELTSRIIKAQGA